MARSPAVLIGVVASVVIAVQNQSAVLGFGWAAIHGAAGGLLAFAPAAGAWAVLWSGPAGIAIQPAPMQFGSVFSTLARDVTYGFAVDLMPVFAGLDERTKKPCLAYAAPRGLSPQDFAAALSKYRDVRFLADITVSYEGDTAAAVRDYVTTNGYDVYAMYQAFVSEGHPRCGT